MGTWLYENAKAAANNEESIATVEAPLFSDVQVIGQADLGPYHLLNPVSIRGLRAGFFRPAIILHADVHFTRDLTQTPADTHTTFYHGGGGEDELASLLSLCLGVRIVAGSVERQFSPEWPRGFIIGPQIEPWPNSYWIPERCNLPWAFRTVDLTTEDLSPIARLHTMSAIDSAALIKAARTYQRAVWLAETDPEFSWLLLVAAIETASKGRAVSAEDAVSDFRLFDRGLAQDVESLSGADVLGKIAKRFWPLLKSKARFLEFIGDNLPPAPQQRPMIPAQLTWTPDGLKIPLSQVYNYRSLALHEGTPFPRPMCERPGIWANAEAPDERPWIGINLSTRGATWYIRDLPMYLHAFEYIVRHSLLNWARSCLHSE